MTTRRVIMVLVLFAVLFGGLLPRVANAGVLDDPTGSRAYLVSDSRGKDWQIRETVPLVLPPLVCDDIPDDYVDALYRLGFSPDGLADTFGEALGIVIGDTTVIVRFSC